MTRHRRSVVGKRLAVFAAIVLACMDLPQGFLIEPLVHADDGQNRAQSSQLQSLDPFFKGKLPITELTEDEAVLHALNRLGYGPRPGDLEGVQQMGLWNWIETQLHPDKIVWQPLEARVWRMP